MHKNNAIALALLKVGGRHKHAQPQAPNTEPCGQQTKHRPKLSSQRVKVLGRGVEK